MSSYDVPDTGVFESPYDQLREHNGKPYTLVGQLPFEDYDFDDCGPLFLIRFEDGTEVEAWPEELQEVEGTVQP